MAVRRTWSARSKLAQPVRWRDISATVRAIAASSDTDLSAVARLALGLTEPLRRLDHLAGLATRALARDAQALGEFKGILADLQTATQDLHPTTHGPRCGCGCGKPETTSTPPEERSAQRALPHDRQAPAQAMLDVTALTSLALAAAWLHGDEGAEASARAANAVVALSMAATPMAELVDVWHREGEFGVAATINTMGLRGELAWLAAPAPMRTMSGSLGGMPGMPALPDIPGLPGGGLPGDLGVPGFGLKRPKTVNDILDLLKPKPHRWDPDDWCPTYPWWREPLVYVDWRRIGFIACLIETARRIQARAQIPPPPRPAQITWADGIVAVEQGGACAGDLVTVLGSGFPDPGDAVFLIPTADGCRPIATASWASDKITFKLPGGVASGSIGFGDAAFIKAYDAWAAEQNRLADELRALGCLLLDVPWVPPYRGCPPVTAVNHLEAGAAIIDAFAGNGGPSAVIEPGVGIYLTWSVRNAHHVRIDRTSARGPTFAGSTTIVDPIGTGYLLAAPTYSQVEVYTYRLTATGPCGAVTRDVSVVATRRPGLWISGVEVTQSIQNTANSVRLVESKPTVVRATVQHSLAGFGGNTVGGVRGRIRVLRANGSKSSWFDAANNSLPMAANPGASITVAANPQRNNTNDTLNFLIPPFWNQGAVAYEIEARVSGFGAGGGFAGFDGQASRTTGTFTYQHRRTLEFRYIRVNWGGSTPSDQVCLDTLRGATPLLPTPAANISALAGVGIQVPTANASGQQGLLDDFDDLHNCSTWEALTEWLGSDCPDDDGTIWVLIPGVFFRGKAYDIPSNVCFTPPGDGPYAAHEISHCLNQTHVSVLCSNGQQASGGDAPSAWPNNAQLVDVPFDVVRNQALTLSGVGVFDVMTYCGSPNNTWPMPARWDRLWDRVGG